MNQGKTPEQTLRSLLPILLVLVILFAGVIIMPTLTADPRSRASEPKTNQSTLPTATKSVKVNPEIVCSDLYSPVCDTAKKITYPNDCEAKLAGSMNHTNGECTKSTQILLPSTN